MTLVELGGALLSPVRDDQASIHLTRIRRRSRRLWPSPGAPASGARTITNAIGILTDGSRVVQLALNDPEPRDAAIAWATMRALMPDAGVIDEPVPAMHADRPWPACPSDWWVDEPDWPALADEAMASAVTGLAPGQQIESVMVSEERREGLHAGTDRSERSWESRRFELQAIVRVGDHRSMGVPFSVPACDPAAVAMCVANTAMIAAGGRHGGGVPADRLLFLPMAMTEILGLMAAAVPRAALGRATKTAACSLVDDARAVGSPLSAPVDHEGTVTGCTTIMRADGQPVGLRTKAGHVGELDPGRLTGHARRVHWHAAARATPTNVHLEPQDPVSVIAPDSSGYTGPAVTAVLGGGTQLLRAGIGFTVELVGVRLERGRVVDGWGPAALTLTPRRMLESIEAVAPTLAYRTGEVATAIQTALVDLNSFRTASIANEGARSLS